MSEKKQGTAFNMHQRMFNRYGDVYYHKHNKDHSQFRMHYRTHPVEIPDFFSSDTETHYSTGLLRAMKLRRMRKRANKGAIH